MQIELPIVIATVVLSSTGSFFLGVAIAAKRIRDKMEGFGMDPDDISEEEILE